MKKLYSFLILIALTSSANATVWAVTVQASAFSPSTLPNVVCGDSIVWAWGGSFSHTTTSTTIPATAATWNAPINSTSLGFVYVPGGSL